MPKRVIRSRMASSIIDAVASTLACLIPLIICYIVCSKNPNTPVWKEPYFLYVLVVLWASLFFSVLVGIVGPRKRILYIVFMAAGTFMAYTYMGISYLFYHYQMYHFFHAGSMIFLLYTIYLATDVGDNDNLAIRMGATILPVLLGLLTVLWFMKIKNFPPIAHLIIASVINGICLIINLFNTLKFFRYHTFETVLNRNILVVEHSKSDGKLSSDEIMESVRNMVTYYSFGRTIKGKEYRLSDWVITNLQTAARRLYNDSYDALNYVIGKVNYKIEHTSIDSKEKADEMNDYCERYKKWIDDKTKEIANKIEDLSMFITFIATETFGSESDKGKVFEYDLSTIRREIRYDKKEPSFKIEIIDTSMSFDFDGYSREAEMDEDLLVVGITEA